MIEFHYNQRSSYDWMIRKYQDDEGLPRQRSAHYAALLDRIPWQLFLTVRGNRGQEKLKEVVDRFRNNCEKAFRAPLTMVYSLESEPSWHLHACIASSCNLRKWNRSFCHRVLQDLVPGDEDNINLQPYDPTRNGLAYVLKTIDYRSDRNDWRLINEHLFSVPSTDDRRDRRRARRHQERLAG